MPPPAVRDTRNDPHVLTPGFGLSVGSANDRIGAWLDVDVDWAILEDLLRDGHQLVALRSRA